MGVIDFGRMTKRLAYRLIMLLLCMAGWQTSVAQTENHSCQSIAKSTLDDVRDNTPQWQDIGMCDVLAITGGSTLTPPTTVRVVHDSPAGTVPTAQAAQSRHCSIQRLLSCSRRRTVSGYIYLIRCLRL